MFRLTNIQSTLKQASWIYPVSNKESMFSSFTDFVTYVIAMTLEEFHNTGGSLFPQYDQPSHCPSILCHPRSLDNNYLKETK